MDTARPLPDRGREDRFADTNYTWPVDSSSPRCRTMFGGEPVSTVHRIPRTDLSLLASQLVSISRGLSLDKRFSIGGDKELNRESIVENRGKERNDLRVLSAGKRRVRKAHNYPGLISRLMSGDGSRRNVAGVRHPIRGVCTHSLSLSLVEGEAYSLSLSIEDNG